MADDDWVAVGYDERVDVFIDGELVMLWWGRSPECAQRTLYAQWGAQRVALASAGDGYIDADRTHRFRVTHGAIKVARADQFAPMRVYNMGSRAGRTTFYGPAWGSVDVSDETANQIQAGAALLRNGRRAVVTTPDPEPTLRPTGGRRFALDDDE